MKSKILKCEQKRKGNNKRKIEDKQTILRTKRRKQIKQKTQKNPSKKLKGQYKERRTDTNGEQVIKINIHRHRHEAEQREDRQTNEDEINKEIRTKR